MLSIIKYQLHQIHLRGPGGPPPGGGGGGGGGAKNINTWIKLNTYEIRLSYLEVVEVEVLL